MAIESRLTGPPVTVTWLAHQKKQSGPGALRRHVRVRPSLAGVGAATRARLGLIRRGYCATTVPRATTPALPARSVAATSIV